VRTLLLLLLLVVLLQLFEQLPPATETCCCCHGPAAAAAETVKRIAVKHPAKRNASHFDQQVIKLLEDELPQRGACRTAGAAEQHAQHAQ
jgi:hypothetical protein